MLKLNEDVLYLIFKEFRNDSQSLYSCLLVNKTWCEIIVPILWKNPWKYLKRQNDISQFNVIISHLPNETKKNLRIQGINLLKSQKPLFNYISFCRYLYLYELVKTITNYHCGTTKFPIVIDEILKLFNRNTIITHIYFSISFHYQIHLIPGAEHCFSNLKLFQGRTDTNTNQKVLEGLAKISKSISTLEIHVNSSHITGVVKLIEAQKNLKNVRFSHCKKTVDESLLRTLEETLIKHAGTFQYFYIDWLPITNILSHLANLKSLVMWKTSPFDQYWNHLGNTSLPALKILKTECILSKSLESLIANTKGHLTEINIDNEYYNCYKGHIKAICQNCPNLKYLKLLLKECDISELEKLLINCQHLDGLFINASRFFKADWNSMFRLLAKSSPTSLFKFKFNSVYTDELIKWDSIRLFLDNWKGRHPMLLQTTTKSISCEIKKYIVEGTVKKYDHLDIWSFGEFEWVQKIHHDVT